MLVYFLLLFVAIFLAVELTRIYGIPFTGFRGEYSAEQSRVLKNLSLIADIKKERFMRWFEERMDDSEIVADNLFVTSSVTELLAMVEEMDASGVEEEIFRANLKKTPTHRTLIQYLSIVKKTYGVYEDIAIFDARTLMAIASTNNLNVGKVLLEDSEAILRDIEYEGVVISTRSGRESGRVSILINHSIRSGNKVVAILTMSVNTDDIFEPTVHVGGGLGNTGEALLVDQDVKNLTTLRHPLPDGSRPGPLEYRITAKPAQLAARGEEGIVVTQDYRNVPVLAAYRHLNITPEVGWGMVVKKDRSEVFAPYRARLLNTAYIFIVATAFLTIMIWIVTRWLASPLVELSLAARKVKEGNLDARAPVSGNDEVASLAIIFNSMVAQIQEWHSNLEAKVGLRTKELEDLNKDLELKVDEISRAEEGLRRYKHIVSSSTDMMALLDTNFTYLAVNSAYLNAFGMTQENFIGKHVSDIFGPELFEKTIKPKALRCIAGEEIHYEEWFDFPANRDKSYMHISYFPYVDDKNEVKGFVVNGRDITSRKRTEKELKKKQEQLEKAQQIGSIGTWELDIEKNKLLWTDETYRIFGLPLGTPLSYETFLNCVHPDDREYINEKWGAAMKGEPYDMDHRLMMDDGRVKWVREKASLEFDDKGNCLRGIGVTQDITTRKQAEESLSKSEERFRDLFEEAPTSLWEEDFSEVKSFIDELRAAGVEDLRAYCDSHPEQLYETARKVRIIGVNQRTLELYKAKDKEELSIGLEETFTDESYRTFKEEILELAAGRLHFESESVTQTLAGETLNIIIRVAIAPGCEETWSRVLVSITNITEMKRAERALKKSEEKMNLIAETALDAIVMIDRAAKIIFWNPAAEELFGYTQEEALGSDLGELIVPERYAERFKKGFSFFKKTGEGPMVGRAVEMTARRKDGSEFPISHSINAVRAEGGGWGAVGIIRDVTEMNRTREMLIQSAKLASIGELAANVAHEINNPMTAILGYSSLIMEELDVSSPYYEDIKTIEQESHRVKNIIRNLLDFSRQRKAEKKMADINEVLKGSISLMAHMSRNSNVTIAVTQGEDLPLLNIDEHQIKQVFINVIGNAVQSMPDGGQLKIVTELSKKKSREGEHATIRFKDTGCGISKASLNKIFDPFYSSKGEKGTGLGLSVSYGIIKNHGGDILVNSKEGKGSTFTVLLPVTE